jgi:hypothetical protein
VLHVPKEVNMEADDTVIAVFADHKDAETAVKKLAAAGLDMKHLSVVGKGYHPERIGLLQLECQD